LKGLGLQFGASDYYEGSKTRLVDAQRLRDARQWSGACYLGGRAAEAMLRGLHWLESQDLPTGHDLLALLKRVRALGLFATDADADSTFQDALNEVAVVWCNDLRFASDDVFARRLRALKRHVRLGNRKVKGDYLKENARVFVQACETLVNRGAVLWQRRSKRS
jgi:hypothetical protein